MEIEWQVCELEDSRKLFIELSVAAVPETWIFQKYNEWWCYWPKNNVLKKIKSCENPNPNDGKWTTYKCRILMNGEKFRTYAEAEDAEKIGQNVSTLESQTENENENSCDSTMDFNVSLFTDDERDMDKKEGIVGNDTYAFNKATAKGGSYCSRKAITDEYARFNINCSDEDTLDKSDAGDSNVSEPDYNNCFNANASNIFTSTLLGLNNLLTINDNLSTDCQGRLLLKISKIETKISSFLSSIKDDFNDLKEIVMLNTHKQKTEPASTGQAITLVSVDRKVENSSPDCIRYALNETFSVDNLPDSLGNNETYDFNQINEHDKAAFDGNENEMKDDSQNVSGENIETFVSLSNALVKAATENVEIAGAPQENAPIPQDNRDENIEHNVENFDLVVHFPVHDLPHWKQNEKLLDEAVPEEALIKHLLPYKNEEENCYFNRTIGLLFSNDFFIDKITWKPVANRALIKNSNILYCWKESHGKTFPEDINDERFKDNIRRVKCAKRAARKSQAKQMLHRVGKRAR